VTGADRDGVDLPVHLRPTSLALVFIGGTAGTAVREALSLTFDGELPYGIFGVNIVGAFLLGLLLEALARRGADRGRRRSLRLLLGTGALGGFTTYSALAAGAAELIGDGRGDVGVAYALATVLIGAVATVAGIAAAAALHRAEGEDRE